MIGFIRGQVCEVTADNVVLDVNNVGYNIQISGKEAERLPAYGEEIKLFTYLSVREDAMKLYGFLTRQDLEFFKLLIGVNGIGPKGAQAILSVMDPDELRFAIMSSDSKTLSKCPGIGSKTAQRIIIELKDKIDVEEMLTQATGDVSATSSASDLSNEKAEACEALTALGFSATDSMKAVRMINIVDQMSVEDIIKEALRHMS